MAAPPNLRVRSLSAIVYAVVFLGSIVSGPMGFILFFTFCFIGCWYEWTKLNTINTEPLPLIMGAFVILVLFLSSYAHEANLSNAPLALLTIVPLLFMLFMELHAGLNRKKNWLAAFSSGLLYIGLPAWLINQMVFINGTYHFEFLLGSIVLIWLNDSGAYFAGSMMGKHPVWPAVSPKKSWEGMFGGFLTSLLAAWFLSDILIWGERYDWIIMSCIISIFGPAGDFFESYFKRIAGVKDSGAILPGHGGFLDRLDSLLFAVPVLIMYLSFREVI